MTKKIKAICPQTNSLINAIGSTNSDATRLLAEQAVKIVYKHDFFDEKMNQKNYETVLALIMDLKPRDTAEAMLAAQYAALHLKAMKAMAEDNYYIMGKVLMMFRLSQQALNMLQIYRGKSQTINVNYNVLNQGNATLNTQIQATGN